jgi:hypothetical protein
VREEAIGSLWTRARLPDFPPLSRSWRAKPPSDSLARFFLVDLFEARIGCAFIQVTVGQSQLARISHDR